MGLGILGSNSEHVPGTVTILDREGHQADGLGTSQLDPNLKYDRTGKQPVVLVPQPSNDPNDPLNWPLLRRDLMFATLSFAAVIATTLSPILAADSLFLVQYYYTGFTEVALLTGYHLLGVGIGGILFVPSARVWGKRHAFLAGLLIVCISCAWGGASNKNYDSLLAARIFQGIGLAPFEALVTAAVGDLYFVHERGKRMALATMAIFGSAFLTPVIVGVIQHNMSWQWTFYFVCIFSGITFFVVLFFVPETAYVRDAALNIDVGPGPAMGGNRKAAEDALLAHYAAPSSRMSTEKEAVSTTNGHTPTTESTTASTEPNPPAKKSYISTLSPFDGRKTNESFFKLFFRPFPLFLNPGITWSCLAQGTLIGWTVLVGIVLAAILLEPPLFFGSVQVGYMYSSAFIGSIAGFILCGLIADPAANYMTRLNGGVYEPEFRIVLVIPQLIFGGIGIYGFGWTSADVYKYSWIGPAVFFGFIVAGMVCGAVASSLYVVDAYRDLAVEVFTCLIIFKNIFSFALTFKGYDWLVQTGIKRTFVIVGSVQVAVCVAGFLVYVFGKKNRAFFARNNILKMLKLA